MRFKFNLMIPNSKAMHENQDDFNNENQKCQNPKNGNLFYQKHKLANSKPKNLNCVKSVT